jgi:hypothetical protein
MYHQEMDVDYENRRQSHARGNSPPKVQLGIAAKSSWLEKNIVVVFFKALRVSKIRS